MRKKLASIFLVCISLLALLLVLLPCLPQTGILSLTSYTLSFLPRWPWLLLVLPMVLFWRLWNLRSRAISVLVLFVIIGFQDFQWRGYFKTKNEGHQYLRVLSVNMGGGATLSQLGGLIDRYQPNIVVMQETQNKRPERLFTSEHWNLDCQTQLCVASAYEIQNTQSLSRKVWQGWGKFAAMYLLQTPFGPIALANVHFETPRPMLEGLRYGHVDWQKVAKITQRHSYQISSVLAWVNQQESENVLIVGDFNITTNQSVFSRSFSNFDNALSEAGRGLNYTKQTSWHGVRIDHQLVDGLEVVEATVVETAGGDHLPVVADYYRSDK